MQAVCCALCSVEAVEKEREEQILVWLLWDFRSPCYVGSRWAPVWPPDCVVCGVVCMWSGQAVCRVVPAASTNGCTGLELKLGNPSVLDCQRLLRFIVTWCYAIRCDVMRHNAMRCDAMQLNDTGCLPTSLSFRSFALCPSALRSFGACSVTYAWDGITACSKQVRARLYRREGVGHHPLVQSTIRSQHATAAAAAYLQIGKRAPSHVKHWNTKVQRGSTYPVHTPRYTRQRSLLFTSVAPMPTASITLHYSGMIKVS